MPSQPLALILSGGGFRGIAHIGVLKYLEEMGIEPDRISGASAGAIVGALYAAGNSPDEILAFFKSISLFRFSNYAFRKAGFIDPMRFRKLLEDRFPDDDFAQLQKKLYIARTNLNTGQSEIISQGPLIDTVLASAAFPFVFAPVIIDGQKYADGGIANNFPLEPFKYQSYPKLGVYVNPNSDLANDELKSTFDIVERVMNISVSKNSVYKFKKCDLVIVPDKLKYHSLFNTSHIDEIFEMGYKAAESNMEQILDIMNPRMRAEKLLSALDEEE